MQSRNTGFENKTMSKKDQENLNAKRAVAHIPVHTGKGLGDHHGR